MFREMSETELTIRNIKNVKMIDIYELTGLNDDLKRGCAAISVIYDVNKNINLCELDDGFELLQRWVFEYYRNIKNNKKNRDLIVHDDVVMNDSTRCFLEYGITERDEQYLEPYYSMTPAEYPEVAFESTLSDRFLPLVSYVLKGLYVSSGIKLKITMEKAGWRGKGVIYGIINRKKRIFAVEIIQISFSEFAVKVNNFLQDGNVLNIKISNNNRSIVLKYNSRYHNIDGKSVFSLNENGYFEKHEFMRNGRQIFCDTWGKGKKEKEKLTADEKKLLPFPNAADSVICLPWGMFFCYQTTRVEKNNFTVEENKCCQLYPKAGYSESECWSVIKNDDSNIKLSLSYALMYKMLLKAGKTQVYFAPERNNSMEKFRKKLEGRYFITD